MFEKEDKRIKDWVKVKRQTEIFFDIGGGYKVLCKYAERDASFEQRSQLQSWKSWLLQTLSNLFMIKEEGKHHEKTLRVIR